MQKLFAAVHLRADEFHFGHPLFCFKSPPQQVGDPRDCPCQPRDPQRAGVRTRVRSVVGLVWDHLYKSQTGHKRPTGNLLPAGPAFWGRCDILGGVVPTTRHDTADGVEYSKTGW